MADSVVIPLGTAQPAGDPPPLSGGPWSDTLPDLGQPSGAPTVSPGDMVNKTLEVLGVFNPLAQVVSSTGAAGGAVDAGVAVAGGVGEIWKAVTSLEWWQGVLWYVVLALAAVALLWYGIGALLAPSKG